MAAKTSDADPAALPDNGSRRARANMPCASWGSRLGPTGIKPPPWQIEGAINTPTGCWSRAEASMAELMVGINSCMAPGIRVHKLSSRKERPGTGTRPGPGRSSTSNTNGAGTRKAAISESMGSWAAKPACERGTTAPRPNLASAAARSRCDPTVPPRMATTS